jgi:uncharacterized protein (TIGR03083 family)
MNASDILKYGQRTVLDTIAGMPEDAWKAPGVCGAWSAKDLMAHLTSFELLLVEILSGYVARGKAAGPTPLLDQYTDPHGNFNDEQVAERARQPIAAILAEFERAHARCLALIAEIPAETLRQPGTQPWYGADYALDDLLVYMYYGHKREHSAQIAASRDRLARG